MLRKLAVFAVVVAAGSVVLARPGDQKDVIKEPTKMAAKESAGPLNFTVKSIDGKDVNLADYRGKVVLFVNVASRCGLTPQYKGLQALYDKYKDDGLVVIGFPANNFAGQEPGTNEEIQQFCTSKYNVTFPMMSKISVAGQDKHPLYKFLTEGGAGQEFKNEVEWNFAKFLVDRNGNVIARFSAKTKPDEPQVGAAVEKALNAEVASR